MFVRVHLPLGEVPIFYSLPAFFVFFKDTLFCTLKNIVKDQRSVKPSTHTYYLCFSQRKVPPSSSPSRVERDHSGKRDARSASCKLLFIDPIDVQHRIEDSGFGTTSPSTLERMRACVDQPGLLRKSKANLPRSRRGTESRASPVWLARPIPTTMGSITLMNARRSSPSSSPKSQPDVPTPCGPISPTGHGQVNCRKRRISRDARCKGIQET